MARQLKRGAEIMDKRFHAENRLDIKEKLIKSLRHSVYWARMYTQLWKKEFELEDFYFLVLLEDIIKWLPTKDKEE